jgi:uncharacterized lipoprotein YddW (UPF0748 family)
LRNAAVVRAKNNEGEKYMTERDKNKPNKSELNWRFENIDTFLRKIFKDLKPQSQATTEKQKREQFLKTIADFGKTN